MRKLPGLEVMASERYLLENFFLDCSPILVARSGGEEKLTVGSNSSGQRYI